jgi:adenosylhomocysteine nucleosidase
MIHILTCRCITGALLYSLLALFATGTVHADVGIITALDTTLEQIKKNIDITEYSTVAGRDFFKGTLQGTRVILVRSPMGKVNNAITAQLLMATFSAGAVISISPAGAVSPQIKIGDVILATEVYQHDFGTWKPYGFIWSKTPAYQESASTNYNRFPGLTGQRIPQQFIAELSTATNTIFQDIIVSGDQFIASAEKRDWLHKKFEAAAVDMGAAAIAQVCYANRTPVILVRVITDSAGSGARTMFTQSMPGYQTTIDLPKLVDGLVRTIIP